MTFEEFQNLARLHVVGGLDPDEQVGFEQGMAAFGEQAEAYVEECRRLESAFALSLSPRAPAPDAREKLLAKIRAASRNRNAR